MISYYAPSMRTSSGDGVSLGGSAYGYTLFNADDGGEQSPFDRVVELLLNERDSKRGYQGSFAVHRASARW
ncbi:hypothetical protein [Streptomyces sp. NPDC056405]|uniref:hypothetical protein n=1 Tax=Streptomyces sp. NPDC056405 TaxID=3345811 RepID=UPI0035D8E01C